MLADREFVGIQWFRYLIENNIKFVIRIKKNTQISNSRGVLVPAENLFRGLPRGGALILSGKRIVWGHSLYVIGLKMADGEFVIIATQEQPETALENYQERWPIEIVFTQMTKTSVLAGGAGGDDVADFDFVVGASSEA